MSKEENPKYSRPHRTPIGSRVFIVDNYVDPYHLRSKDIIDYTGRNKKKNTNWGAQMLSEYSRNNI